MANYIIGDIQGCYASFRALLEKINFKPKDDKLWLVGDLVARGEDSLLVLRFVYKHRKSIQIVLGNHDIHLLAVSEGIHSYNKDDKTQSIFNADDKHILLNWLRKQPLLAEHDDFVICHAGISPQWDLSLARQCADDFHSVLRGDKWRVLLSEVYGNLPNAWSCDLKKWDKLRYIMNAYTRMRFCNLDGSLNFNAKNAPKNNQDAQLIEWFKVRTRAKINKTILFGHWAALDGYEGNGVIGLDTGCVWGRKLTALKWEERRYFTQELIK